MSMKECGLNAEYFSIMPRNKDRYEPESQGCSKNSYHFRKVASGNFEQVSLESQHLSRMDKDLLRSLMDGSVRLLEEYAQYSNCRYQPASPKDFSTFFRNDVRRNKFRD
jgi:hypothetical protein